MTVKKVVGFDDFLEDSFKENVSRELRLSAEELEYLLSKYPKATVTALSRRESADGKCWYLVQF
ncbi:MAG: hypothetical protein GX750_01950 [Clostridia bacterium]|nr:hypothetical protein [Clostridia bacterium]